MNTIEIPEKKIKVEIPSSIDELTREQHDFVFKQLAELEADKISLHDFNIYVLFHLLGINYGPMDHAKAMRMTEHEQGEIDLNIARLLKLIEFFFKQIDVEGKPVIVFDYTTINNFNPDLKIDNGFFYGPGQALMDITFGEYRHALVHFNNYIKNKQDNDLDLLIAVLWRPERIDYDKIKDTPEFDGCRKEPFNPARVEKHASLISHLPQYKKNSMFMFFRNCMDFLRTSDIDVGGHRVNFSLLFSGGEEESKGIGMTGTLFRLAESGVFGDIEKTDQQNLYDILLMLYQWKVDYDKMKSKTENT